MAVPLSNNTQLAQAPVEASLVEPEAPRGYTIAMQRYDAAGRPNHLNITIPDGANMDAIKDNPVMLAAVLKDGDPVWKQYDFGFVLVAVMHSRSLGLDIMQGDIYPIEGRLGVSDWAKIKYARSHMNLKYTVEMVEGGIIKIPWKTRSEEGLWEGNDLTCTVKFYEAGAKADDMPVSTYTTSLKAWFEGRSKEWKERTRESLRRKALARGYQELCPVGTEPSEAPPLPEPSVRVYGNPVP